MLNPKIKTNSVINKSPDNATLHYVTTAFTKKNTKHKRAALILTHTMFTKQKRQSHGTPDRVLYLHI